MPSLKKNILVVDDDDSQRKLLRKLLENTGYGVHEAPSVKEAIRSFQELSTDLVILDLSMPEHDGFTLLKVRQQTPKLHDVPVVILSSMADKTNVEKAKALGAEQFLPKPVQAPVLLQRMRMLFYAKDILPKHFSAGSEPNIFVTVKSLVTGLSDSQAQIMSPVKLSPGKAVEIRLPNFSRKNQEPLVARVDNRLIQGERDHYKQTLSFVGIDLEDKELIKKWRRKKGQS